MRPVDRISLRARVRQSKHTGLHLPVFVRRLSDRYELQGSGLGAEGDHRRQGERVLQLADVDLHIQRRALHHGADELSEQVAGPVRHVDRHANLLRLLHDPGDSGVRDSVSRVGKDEREGHRGRQLRLPRSDSRYIPVERFQGDGRALRQYQAHAQTEKGDAVELQFEMGLEGGRVNDEQSRVAALAQSRLWQHGSRQNHLRLIFSQKMSAERRRDCTRENLVQYFKIVEV